MPQSHCYRDKVIRPDASEREKKFPSKDYIFFFVKTVVQVVIQSSDNQIGFFSAQPVSRDISQVRDPSTK